MSDADTGVAVAGGGLFLLIWLAVAALMIASMWKVFTKAGEPGWASIVPLYNLIILLKIVGKPAWWIVMFMIPLVNFYALYVVCTGIAKSFGKSSGFGLGLMFLGFIFFPILGFGDARYQGVPPSGSPVPLAV